MISWLNHISPLWLSWMTAMLWQSSILIACVYAIDLAIRRFAWPQLRYTLWLLVFVKLVLPPGFAMSTGLISHVTPLVTKYLQGPADSSATNPAALQGDTGAAFPLAKHVTHLPVASTSQAIHAARPAISLQSWLMLVWLSGIIALCLWLCRKLWMLRSSAEPISLPQWFPQVLRDAADKAGLRHLPPVIVTRQVKCPAVLGALHPLVLVPADRVDSFSKHDTGNMLVHELTHIKRGDLLVHAIQLIVQVVYWPNVLLWLVRRPIHDLRELCCDASVAAALRQETPAYRQTLLDTARTLIAEPVGSGLGLLGLFERPHAIVERLSYLERPYRRQNMCKFVTLAAIAAMFVFVLPMSLTKAETNANETNNGAVVIDATTGMPAGTTGTIISGTSGGGMIVSKTTGIAMTSQEQHIDANAIEFRVLWTAGKDLLPDEVDAIKAGSSPLIIGKECIWADLDPNVTAQANWVTRTADGKTQVLVSNRPTEVLIPGSTWAVKNVTLNTYPDRKPELGLQFDTKGSTTIADLTSRNIERPIAILVHGQVVSAPILRAPITDKAVITGNFTVSQLSTLMNSIMIRSQIKIEAHIITAPAATMKRLLEQVGGETSRPVQSSGMQSTSINGKTTTTMTNGPSSMLAQTRLSDDMAASLLTAVQSQPDVRILFAPTIITQPDEPGAVVVANDANDGRDQFSLRVTPHLARKGDIRLETSITIEKIRDNGINDVRSTSTILVVQPGKMAVVSGGGTDKSMMYTLIKATPVK
jgi:beta-lactamase regulating signal transducer with metallopeptidase domain